MLPAHIKILLDEAVSRCIRTHHTEREKAFQEFAMANRGLKRSSFNDGKKEVYYKVLEKSSLRVWDEMKKTLESEFEYYPGCDGDLINFLKVSLLSICQADAAAVYTLGIYGAYTQKTSFGVQNTRVIERIVIEICRYTTQLRAKQNKEAIGTVSGNVAGRDVIVGENVVVVHESQGDIPKSEESSIKRWTIVIAIATVIGLIVSILEIVRHRELTTSQVVNNSPGTIQAGRDVTIIQSPMPPQSTKQDFRTFFERINPEIIRRIDAGQTEIDVFLGPVSQVKLSDFSQRQDFKNYLSFKQTSSMNQGGRGNSVNDFINEIGEQGMMTGYILYPKDALRR